MKIPFVTSGLNRTSEGLPAFELQNLYPAMEGEELQGVMRPGPCLVQIVGTITAGDFGASPIRGLFQFPGAGGGLLYFVHGSLLHSWDGVNPSTSLGTVAGTDPVIFDMIRDTVILSANGLAYFTTGGTRTQITDPDLGTVSSVAGIDGRLLASRDASDSFVWSEVFDPGNIGSLSFATAEKYGDRLVRVMTHESGLVALFGERSTEIWQPTGDATTPFVRAGGMVYPFGCAAKMSCAKYGPLFFFVAVSIGDGSPCVGMMSPSFERISDPGVEILLRSLSTANLAAIRAFAYRQNGATFYQMTLPGLGTWAFHVESGTWFRRRYGAEIVWHSSCYADAFGKHLVGSDLADGIIREMRADLNRDNGFSINRIATCYLPVERPTPIQSLIVDAATQGAGATLVAWRGRVRYATGGHGMSDSFRKDVPAPSAYAQNNWVEAEWDMSALTAGGTDWTTNTITQIEFNLAGSVSDWEIDWVKIVDAGGTPILEYNFDSGLEGWIGANGLAEIANVPSVARLLPTGQPVFRSPAALTIDGSVYYRIQARLRCIGGLPTARVELSETDGQSLNAARDVFLDKNDGTPRRAPLSLCWGAMRRPGALARVTVSGGFRVALYNLLVNELAT